MDYQSTLRALILAVCMAGLPGLSQAMEHFVRPLQDQNGRAIAGATVSIYIAGSSTLATIYSDNGATVKHNPITTGVDGMMDFYAPNGLYDLSPVAKGYVFNINQYKRLTVIDPSEIGGGPPGSCVRTVSGTSDSILSSDSGCIVIYTDTGIVTVSIPQAGSAGFGTSFNVTILNLNATQLTIIPISSTIQTTTELALAAGQSTDIRSDGANYYHAPGIKNITGWPQSDVLKEITWANSEANAELVGDGTRKERRWCEATNGCITKPDPIADTVWRIWPGMLGQVFDEEQSLPLLVIDPNSITAGSGTVTLQSAQQLVLSNLGVEFAESDTNPSCSSGKFNIYADLSENKLKKCQDGVISDISAVGAGSVDGVVRRSSDSTPVNNSTVFVNDDTLLIPLSANSTYIFDGLITYNSSSVADIKIDFTVPAGASGRRHMMAGTTAISSCSTTSINFSGGVSTSELSVGATGADCDIPIKGTITTGGTSGNFQVQFAQNTAEASNTVLKAGSYLYWRKLP